MITNYHLKNCKGQHHPRTNPPWRTTAHDLAAGDLSRMASLLRLVLRRCTPGPAGTWCRGRCGSGNRPPLRAARGRCCPCNGGRRRPRGRRGCEGRGGCGTLRRAGGREGSELRGEGGRVAAPHDLASFGSHFQAMERPNVSLPRHTHTPSSRLAAAPLARPRQPAPERGASNSRPQPCGWRRQRSLANGAVPASPRPRSERAAGTAA